jgi:hypothetical protein
VISEPMTLATDYALGLVSAWLGWRLVRLRQPSQKAWGMACLALALAAFLGGTWHGLVQSDALWTATTLCVGLASFGMVVGSAREAAGRRMRQALIAIAIAKLVIYSLWMMTHDEFIYVVIDSGSALVIVAGLHAWRRDGWMIAGVACSVLGALVQAAGLAPHEDFNHNDLYHLIQIVAMMLFYQGVARFRAQ